MLDFSPLFQQLRQRSEQLRTTTALQRIEKLKALKAAVAAHESELEAAMFADFKKPALEVQLTELGPFYMEIKHFVDSLHRWMKPISVSSSFPFWLGKSQIRYEPKGVVLIIAPWNYPFNLAMTPLIAALAAGNAVVIKPSEFTPATSEVIRKIIAAVFPPDEVSVVTGDAEVAKSLLKLPFHHIFFTGSTAVGKEVMRAAANHLSGITLELGGKSPAIVDESADLKMTAEKLVWGKLLNAGQTCIAPDYVLINQDMIPVISQKLTDALETMYGSEGKAHADFPALVSRRHFDRMQRLVEDAVEKGAEVIYGGKGDVETLRFEPTVLIKVSDDMLVMQEEIFGPVLPIVGIGHSADAIKYINEHDKPLALYIFSNNNYKTEQILQQTSSGGSCVNDLVVHIANPNLPFGGVNHSGSGSYHGQYGFKAFSHERSVFYQFKRFNLNKMLYPPYNGSKNKVVKWLVKFMK
ncbi:MAG: aldehyde dehydrogenase family protein [Sphingobacteriaceae bacterium]|nr:aldehyde dehydrogenase family protein [Sphingobacteriaceae bacterium]